MIYVGSLLTVGVCAYAIHRGGEAERVVSITALVALFGSLLAQTLLGRATAWPVIGADILLSVVLAVVTAIHLRPWLFVELALALLIVHGVVASEAGVAITFGYAAFINGLNLAMLLVLAVAAARSRRGEDALLAPADVA